MDDDTFVNTGRVMSVIARWCFRHRLVVIAAWVVVLTGLSILAQAIKSDYNNSFSLPGTGSATAQELLARAVPAQAGDSDTIVWRVSHGTVREAVVMARMGGVLRQVAAMPAVAAVASPYRPRGAAQISRDGRIAYATVQFAGQASDLAKADITRVVNTAEAARAPGLDVQLGGQAMSSPADAWASSRRSACSRPRWCCSSRSARCWRCCCRWSPRSPGSAAG